MPSAEQTLLALASELKGTYPPAELAQLARLISPVPQSVEMSAEDFEALRQILIAQNNRRPYSDKSLTAARLVLVMGASIAEAAEEVGLARQVVHRLMVRIRRRMAAVPSDWVKISEWYSRDIAEQLTTLAESLRVLQAAGSPLPVVSFILSQGKRSVR